MKTETAPIKTVAHAETTNPQDEIQKARRALAAAHGLEIVDEAVVLDDKQAAEVAAQFGDTREEQATAVAKLQRYGGQSTLHDRVTKRYDKAALSRLIRAEIGETVPLIRPASEGLRFDEIDEAAAPVTRALAVRAAAQMVGVAEQDVNDQLAQGSGKVYSSPQNGAPIISERVIELPSATLYEMNLHGVGDPGVIDSQVVAVRK